MKLLLISVKSASPNGGIAVWTDCFLNYCQKSNIDCHLINTKIIGNRAVTSRRSLLDELKRTHRIIYHLRQELKHNAFDAVYLNTSCGTYGLFRDAYLGRIIRKKKITLITHYHCDIPYWVKHRISKFCLKKLAQSSQYNFTLCQNSQNFLQDSYGISSYKIPNFIDYSLIRTTPKPIEKDIKRIIFVGHLTENKGAGELYSIAKYLPHIQFTLIGNINSTVAAWSKPANITLTGQISQEEVVRALDKADIFLFPSHTEGCSMALMEAMARGLPAIATDTGANAEMLADGCGIVVPIHNTAAMLNAIDVLNDTSLRQSMSKKAIEYIKEHHTAQNVKRLLTCFDSLIKFL